MFARSSSFTIPMDKADEFHSRFHGEVEKNKSQIEQMPGYMGGYWMFDRKTGKALVVTFFDSEQSLRDSEETATRIRAGMMSTMGVMNPPAFDTYEVGAEVPGRMRRAA